MYALKGKDGTLSHLKGISHEVTINDVFSSTRTTMRYKNMAEKPLEMEYCFPKPSGSSISNVVVRMTDPKTGETSTLVADVQEKEIAEEKYDDGIASGNTAMLMKHTSRTPAASVLIIGNVPAKYEVDVTFERIEELKVEAKENSKSGEITTTLQYTIPAMHVEKDHGLQQAIAGNESMKIMDVKIEIKNEANIDILKIGSPSLHDENQLLISEDLHTKNKFVTLKEPISNENNFTLEVTVKDYPICRWFYHSQSPKMQSHYVSFLPQVKQKESSEVSSKDLHEIILIVDRSGSMSGTRMKFAREALKLVLYSLDEDDKILFNIVSFGSHHDSLYPTSVLFTEKTFRESLDHCQKMKADYGGTHMLGPLKSSICEMPIKEGYTRNLLLLTDGEDDNPTRTLDFAMENKDLCRIYSFGIGQGINPSFLTELSSHTNGRAVFIERNDKIEELVVGQLERTLQPQIKDLRITFPEHLTKTKNEDKGGKLLFDVDHQQKQLLDSSARSINNEPMVNYANVSKCFLSSENVAFDHEKDFVKVEYRIGSETVEYEIHPKRNEFVGIVSGQRRIKSLESRMKILKKNRRTEKLKSLKEEVSKLGLLFHLLTSQTSFVMVAENEVKVTEEMIHEVIPTILFTTLRSEDKEIEKRLKEIEEQRIKNLIAAEQRRQRYLEEQKRLEEERKQREAKQRLMQQVSLNQQAQAIPPKISNPHAPPKLPPKPVIPKGPPTEREKNVFMSKACEQCERYEEMFGYISKVCEDGASSGCILSVEERNLLSVSMKNIIGFNRTSFRILTAIYEKYFESEEKKEEGERDDDNDDNKTKMTKVDPKKDDSSEPFPNLKKDDEETKKKKEDALRSYIQKVENIISQKCDEMVLLCTKLTSCGSSGSNYEFLTFIHKLCGDYFRYKCELTKFQVDKQKKKVGDDDDEKMKKDIDPILSKKFEEEKEKAKEEYKKAGQHASQLSTTHPIRLGLKLNLSVFCYEILEDPQLASKIAKGSFEDAIEELDTLTEEDYKDSTLIMQLLKDNLTLWSGGDDEEDEGEFEDEDEDLGPPLPLPNPSSVPQQQQQQQPSVNIPYPNEKKSNYSTSSQQQQNVIPCKIDLNKLLFSVNFKGMWKCDGTGFLLNLKEEEIKSRVPKLLDDDDSDCVKQLVDLWMTAIVIVVLEKYFKHVQTKWRMIVKKSKKVLTKNGVLDLFLKEAKKFVDEKTF